MVFLVCLKLAKKVTFLANFLNDGFECRKLKSNYKKTVDITKFYLLIYFDAL